MTDKHLTPREIEIVQLVWNGLTSQQMALALGISRRTVEVHRFNIARKFNVTTTGGMLRVAFEHQIIGGTHARSCQQRHRRSASREARAHS